MISILVLKLFMLNIVYLLIRCSMNFWTKVRALYTVAYCENRFFLIF